MKRNIYKLVLILILSFISIPEARDIELTYSSELEEQLFIRILNEQKFYLDTLSSFLIAQGVSKEEEIIEAKNAYRDLLSKIQNEIDIEDDFDDLAEDIFFWFHKNLLKEKLDISTIYKLLMIGKYDILSANILYLLVCNEFDIPISILANPYYLKTQLNLEDVIEVDILDKNNGFDSAGDKDKFVENLVFKKIIEKSEMKKKGIKQIYSDYFTDYKSMSEYEIVGFIYYYFGNFIQSNTNYKPVIESYEKALVISPNNESYITYYILMLAVYSENMKIDDQIKYFQNSLNLLNDRASYSNFAIEMATLITHQLTNERQDYFTASKLVQQFQTMYNSDNFVQTMSKLEYGVEFDWIIHLTKKGYTDSAYTKLNKLNTFDSQLPRHRDLIVQVSIDYSRTQVLRNQQYEEATNIMDSLLVNFPDYPVVKDNYIHIVLAPFQLEYNYVRNNFKKALTLAEKAFEVDPKNSMARRALASSYHENAMSYVRKNDLINAFILLEKGLDIMPNEKMLKNALSDIKYEMAKNR